MKKANSVPLMKWLYAGDGREYPERRIHRDSRHCEVDAAPFTLFSKPCRHLLTLIPDPVLKLIQGQACTFSQSGSAVPR